MSRIISFLLLAFLVPTLVLATPGAPDAAPSAPRGVASVSAGIHAAVGSTGLQNFCEGTFSTCVIKIAGGVINIVLSLVGILVLGYTLYAGFLWMTSGGEKEGAESAMKMLRQAVIGLIIVVSAFAISSFVLDKLSVISTGPVATPAQGVPPT